MDKCKHTVGIMCLEEPRCPECGIDAMHVIADYGDRVRELEKAFFTPIHSPG